MAEKIPEWKERFVRENKDMTWPELANHLWISKMTVSRIRAKFKDDTQEEIKEVLQPNKDDIKKLELVKNLTPKQIEEILYHNTIATKSDKIKIQTEEIWHALFWAIWDTHFWSKHTDYKWLHKYYDKCRDRWVKTVLHAWDLVDWIGVDKWHNFELAKHWADDQLKDVVENYPLIDWIDTHFIWGNHDESLLKLVWYDILKQVELLRKDMHFLWRYDATIEINGIKTELHHWGWWNAYSISYKPQKYLETIDPKAQPNVFLEWHFHSSLYMFYRKIHTFMVASFQKPTLFSTRMKFWNTRWWRIIEVRLDNDWWTKINLEFISTT